MNIPTEDQYIAALDVVKSYELNQDILFSEKVKAVVSDLDVLFNNTEIKSYRIRPQDWLGNKCVEIIPIDPEFDEDYNGEFDEAIEKLAQKHGCKVKMASEIYSK